MADNLEKIEKRLDSIEQRLAHLESPKGVEKTIDEPTARSAEKQENSVPSFPVGSLLLLGLGGIIIWNSLPGFLSRMFFGSYNRYGGSYVDFGSLIFAGIGCVLFVLGLRSILAYRDSKSGKTNVSGKSESGIENAQPLEINSGGQHGDKKEDDRGESIEYQIASHWFGIVGVVAILFGVALFLKYAFDNDWIGPAGQVSIGVIFGIFLLGLGEYFRTKYAQYSQILSGCGLGVLYLSLWSAYSIFKLIDAYTVMGAMTLVTATAALLAIRYNSVYIAVLGILGGFVTPLLLGKGLDQTLLLVYVLVLNIGVLLIAFFKNWKSLNLITFAATFIDFSVWYSNLADRGQYTLEAFVFLTVFFIIFSLVWVVYSLIYERKVEDVDILLSLLNALVYFGFSFMILSETYKDYMGFFAFAVALYYAVFGFIAYTKFKADSVLTLGFLGTSILFLTVAVPLQVDRNLITIVWAIEGVVLVWLSFWISIYKLRVAALGIYILVAIRLVGFDANLPFDNFALIFNKRFITFVIAAISAGVAAYLYKSYQNNVLEEEKPVLPALLIGLNVILVAALTLESVSYFGLRIQNLNNVLYKNQTNQIVNPNVQNPYDRQRTGYSPYQNTYNNNLPDPKVEAQIRNSENQRNISISIIWLVYSLILLMVGVVAKYKPIRLSALAFFAITILKVFLVDSANLQQLYRIIAFISLGTILLVVAYIYQRYKQQINAFLLNG